MGSHVSGITLTNAGLGAVHGFAGPIGGFIYAPHGTICASLLPALSELNIKAIPDFRIPHILRFPVYEGSPGLLPETIMQQ